MPNKEHDMNSSKTDCKMGIKGASTLGKALKVNRALTTLNLDCALQQQDNTKTLTRSERKQTKQTTISALKEWEH